MNISVPRTPTKDELEGRSSGSLGWRMSRGETGLLQTTSNHTFTLHHTARITTLCVKYNPVTDVYICDGVVGPAELQVMRNSPDNIILVETRIGMKSLIHYLKFERSLLRKS